MSDYNIEKLNKVPIVPLRGKWLFPGMSLDFDAGRDFTIEAINQAKLKDDFVLLVVQKDQSEDQIDVKDFYNIGVYSKIRQSIKLPDGNYRVIVDGIARGKAENIQFENNYFSADVAKYEEKYTNKDSKLEALKRISLEKFQNLIERRPEIPDATIFFLETITDVSEFADRLIVYIQPTFEQVQLLLEQIDVKLRLEMINTIIDTEIEIIDIKDELNKKVTTKINQGQKEYYLREQLQAIKQELEESDGGQSYSEEYKEKIENLPIKEEYKEHLRKELSRLEYVSGASPESNVIRTYIDNVLDIPFGIYSDDNIDIKKSREILNKDHHGLKDVKERILEFLAVRKLKENMKGSILCLVGPPGVGKTSIVKSVAESMNREYISMRLGGLGDESEIRGHRKTYIGAMPGRIITSLQRAKTLNPVLLLDEIDKISSDYRSDPASALLEVLDPNQNSEFMDRYIEIPVDLSRIMFVTTANTTQTIPRALMDRMEIIEISGYTEYDKIAIAKKYLVPKQIREHGLTPKQLNISDAVLEIIIKNYTRESGVRNLEREISKIVRKAAMKIVEGSDNIRVSKRNYREFLGREKVLDDDIVKTPQVGIVTGLAWTQVGGELLQIEVNATKGKGKVQLTGSLGDVMKESAMASLSYIKSIQEELQIPEDYFVKTDFHVHVPEGATPKDGPSAGITITVGLVSAITKRKVRQDIAMTGEVTLRGRVLPIGGLKEKSLAALRYGITNVIIPKQNERDLEDFPKEVLSKMKFYPVSDMHEVLELALEKEMKEKKNEN
ncbi:endopeptidase La [Helcococcus sueciensis]|uniref:endopeptidase La n=1 Tax=Helcococcus sueciensis TaxID=241555 RepID=UPI000401F258|nr:endopeptidase La [Helcococcus sueciensis]